MIDRWFEPGWVLHSLKSTTDTGGNPIEGWSTGTAISGRYRPLSGDRRLSADKHSEFADGKFYCPIGTSAVVGDQIRRGSEVYTVTFPHNPMDMDRFWQLEVRKP